MSSGRWMVLGLLLAVIVVSVLVLRPASPPPRPPTPSVDPAPLRRGDDSTYAEELKAMTALMQQMRYEITQLQHRETAARAALSRELSTQLNRRLADLNQRHRQLSAEFKKTQTALTQAVLDEQQARSELQAAVTKELQKAQRQGQQALQQTQPSRAALTPQEDSSERLKHAAESSDASTDASQTPTPLASALASTSQANRILTPRPESADADASDDASDPLTALERGQQRMQHLADHAPDDAPQWTLDPQGLERLRQLTGQLTGQLASSTTGLPTLGPKPAEDTVKRIPGIRGAYVTIKPYRTTTTGRYTPFGVAQSAQTSSSTVAPVDSARRIAAYPFEIKTNTTRGASAVIPVYTLPDAATLVANRTMTPLVGRVPNAQGVRDPFRFKVITGATNLASNGLRIPGIAHAVWTGYAVGIGEQSCVRGYLDTVTFTFEDGRIHTVNKGKGSDHAQASVNHVLGHLTDPWGKPCIRGQLFNNAGAYLRQRGVAAFLEGLANAYARAQLRYERNDDQLSAYVEGDTYQYALSQGLSGGAKEIADYVRERADRAFDVVYVPPGSPVQIFIETQIPIDYDTAGRKIAYDYTQGESDERLD